jgi:trimethylamine:corrinoid methyltransferase-like protein
MQKDFMGMAQGQGQAAPQSNGSGVQLQQELQEVGAEGLNNIYKEAGMPTENTPEAAKQRVMMVLEELGVLEGLRQDQLQQLQQLVDEFVQLAQKGDMAALEQHPISQLLNQAQQEFQQAAGMPQQAQTQQGQTEPTATKDFASMMPPAGGGLGGR